MASSIERRQNPMKVRGILRDGWIPAMRGFTSWTSSSMVTRGRSLDATAEFPGPFYIVDRLALNKNGRVECLTAVVQFDRRNRPYVEGLFRGRTQKEAREKFMAAARAQPY